jgi:hypothetical protein
MTTPEIAPPPVGPPPTPLLFGERVLASLERAVALLAVLLLMGTVGLVLTNVRSQYAFHYWAAMFPLFGVAALWDELRRRPDGAGFGGVALRVVAHWIGPLAALWIVFRFLHLGQVDGQTAGLLAVLVLALCCFFGGIYGAPVWLAVAAFLAAGILVALEVEAYLWLLVVLGALLVAGLVVWRLRSQR